MLTYGAEHVRRRMEEERRAREARRIAKANPGAGTLCEPVARWMARAVVKTAASTLGVDRRVRHVYRAKVTNGERLAGGRDAVLERR